jgi:hypothetical protein
MNNRREFIMSAVLAGAAVPLAKGYVQKFFLTTNERSHSVRNVVAI